MSLIRLQKSSSGKGVWATYAFNLFKLEFYLRHNKSCRGEWGEFYISCYVHRNSSGPEIEGNHSEFTSYADFRKYRNYLYETHGTDKRLKGSLATNTVIESIKKMDDLNSKIMRINPDFGKHYPLAFHTSIIIKKP